MSFSISVSKTAATLAAFLLLSLAAAGSPSGKTALQQAFDRAVEKEDYQETLRLGHTLAQLLIKQNKLPEASVVYREMGSACFFRGEFSNTIRYCTAGLALLKKDTAPLLAFKHASTLAESYSRISMLDSAAYWFLKSEELIRSTPSIKSQAPDYVHILYNNIGALYLKKNDNPNALLYYEKTLTMAIELTTPRAIGIAYNSLANHYNRIAAYDLAESHYKKAMGYFNPGSIDRSWITLSLGNNEFRRHAYTKALTYFTRSKHIYETYLPSNPDGRNLQLEKWLLLYTARCHYKLENLTHAEAAYRQCMGMITVETPRRSEELAYCLLGLGQLSESRQEYPAALEYYQKALVAASVSFQNHSLAYNPEAGDQLSDQALLDILIQKAECLQKQKIPGAHQGELVFDTYLRAVAVAGKLRKDMGSEASKLFFAEKLRPVFNAAAEVAYEQYLRSGRSKNWAEKITGLFERSRQVVLSDILHERHIRPRAIPKEMLEKEIQLETAVSQAKIRYAQAEAPKQKDSCRAALNQLQIDMQHLRAAMEYYNPEYIALRHQESAFRLDNVREGLQADQAYLGYYLDDQYLYSYVLTGRNARIERSILPPNFMTRLETLQSELRTDPELHVFTEERTVNWFYKHLIGPVYDELSRYPRWLIARDGKLNLIPFEVLSPRGNATPLGLLHAIGYVHSADRLARLPAKPHRVTSVVGFAPFTKDTTLKVFEPLEYTENEIRETSNLVFLDGDAAKAVFLKMIPQADILHLATHASYNDSIPENSFIAFSPRSTDYRLYAHEIANLSLTHVRMVLLSFCDADRGKAYNGEGIISMARAFRLAGCPGVLATLWKADDEITSFIATAFFRHLHTGKPADVALQRARADYLSSPLGKAWNHPYYWANIIYMGDTSPVFPPEFISTTARQFLFYGAVPLLLTGLLFYGYRRRRNNNRP